MDSYLQLTMVPQSGKVIVSESTDSGQIRSIPPESAPNESEDVFQIMISSERSRKEQKLTDLEKMYRQYTVCRSFVEATYQQHINMNLINKRSKSGLIVLCPHIKVNKSEQASSQYGSRILSILKENGNMNRLDHHYNYDAPYLSRLLPTPKDLREGKKLTEELKTKRGPGRPFGTYAPKRTKKEMKMDELDPKSKKKSRSKRVHIESVSESISGLDQSRMETKMEEPPDQKLSDNIKDLTDIFNVEKMLLHLITC